MRFTPIHLKSYWMLITPGLGGKTQQVHGKFSYLLIVFDSVSVVFEGNGYKRLR